MEPDEVFQLALLNLTEAIANIIQQRSTNTKRNYWVERMRTAINGIDATYKGTLPVDFVERADRFNQKVEKEMMQLLRGYRK